MRKELVYGKWSVASCRCVKKARINLDDIKKVKGEVMTPLLTSGNEEVMTSETFHIS
jgi:hypothetical protein